MKKRILSLVLCAAMLLSMCLFLGAGVTEDTTADGSAESTESYIPAVNFTNVAPFVQANAQVQHGRARAPMRAANVNGDSGSADKGVVTSKTATANADGTYTIKLTSYTTGTVTQQKTTKPTDIVLVLDQSGSMAKSDMTVSEYTEYTDTTNSNLYSNGSNLWYKQGDSYVQATVTRTDGYNYKPYSGQTNGTYYNYKNRNNLYAYVKGQPQKVTVERSGRSPSYTYTYTIPGATIAESKGKSKKPEFRGIDGGKLYLHTKDYVYAYSYTDNGAKVPLGTSTGADTRFQGAVLYSKTDKTIRRLEALQTAVTNFVNQIAQKATEEDVDHRIAIVGFASDNNDKYNNTELLTGCTITEKEVTSSGTSYFPTGKAMNGVQYKSANAEDYQNALVTMNTDDGKTSAENAIAALTAYGGTETNKGMDMAKQIFANDSKKGKDRNRVVVLFTDGVPGHNYKDGTEKINSTYANPAIKCANDISTDYSATIYTVGIFGGANGENPKSLPANGDWYNGETANSTTANRFMHLVSSNYPDATDMATPGNVNSSLKSDDSYYLSAGDADTLNNIFEKIGDNISKPSINLGSKAEVRDIVSPYFNAPENAEDITVYAEKAKPDNSGGYTWEKDAAYNDSHKMNVAVEGQKVTVSGFDYDANFVSEIGRKETNPKEDGDFHGRRLVVEFNVTVKPEFLGGNGVPTNLPTSGVYDESGKVVENFEYPRVNIPVKAPALTPANKNIYYNSRQLKPEDLCTPNIAVGMADYVDLSYSADKAISNTEDGNYIVTVTATPKYPIAGEEQKSASEEAKATVTVFKPEVTYQDCTTDYGVAPQYQAANFVSAVWKNSQGESADDVSMTGDEPELTYAYMPVDESFTKDTYVNVTVSANGAALPKGVVAFKHNDCTFSGCSFDSAQGQFIVHIKVFDLTIKKTAKAGTTIDPNQTFVFKVQNNETNQSMEVVITGDGQQTIKNLPMGSYTITEDTNWSWKYTPTKNDQQVTTDNIQDGMATVSFENEKKPNNWLTSLAEVINKWINGQIEKTEIKN